jgi:hypothetical protein
MKSAMAKWFSVEVSCQCIKDMLVLIGHPRYSTEHPPIRTQNQPKLSVVPSLNALPVIPANSASLSQLLRARILGRSPARLSVAVADDCPDAVPAILLASLNSTKIPPTPEFQLALFRFLLLSSVVLMEKFDPKSAFELIQKEGVTLQPGAPAHYIMELGHPERNTYNLSSLRAGLIAGQIAPEGLITRVEKDMGVYITSFWGASEVGPGVGLMNPYPSPPEIREKYVGRPIADTRVRIVDSESRKELPDGEIGELTLSGWHVMKGYWNKPGETENVMREINGERFFLTGDIGHMDEEGFFIISDRKKQMINVGGLKAPNRIFHCTGKRSPFITE